MRRLPLTIAMVLTQTWASGLATGISSSLLGQMGSMLGPTTIIGLVMAESQLEAVVMVDGPTWS